LERHTQLAIKRGFDLVAAAAALTALAPVMAAVAISIRVDDRGPIFFKQQRVGEDGKHFACYKFRSMVVNAERLGRGLELERDDPRITRVGRVIRDWRLDELPQLLNVLKGDMSVIGPRPTVPSQVARYTPRQMRRLEMKPGLAGWSTVHGANALPWDQRIELDLWYIDHWSLWLDVVTMWKALRVIAKREGLYDRDGQVRDFQPGAS
jgi:lipopolysaccharide/colanic/teichoic acid biosynthesis glycosyltransferase